MCNLMNRWWSVNTSVTKYFTVSLDCFYRRMCGASITSRSSSAMSSMYSEYAVWCAPEP